MRCHKEISKQVITYASEQRTSSEYTQNLASMSSKQSAHQARKSNDLAVSFPGNSTISQRKPTRRVKGVNSLLRTTPLDGGEGGEAKIRCGNAQRWGNAIFVV